MDSFKSLAMTRRSIRKYSPDDIPLSDIEDFIKIASSAPSGCNSQCWNFVAIKDRDVLDRIANTLVDKINEILSVKGDEITREYLLSKKKMLTFFLNAPVSIAVFMTHLEYYDPTLTSALNAKGYTHDEMMKLFAYPDLLSIGAAIQNLLLAVHEKGYGACWMNEPAIVGEEIREILNVPKGQKFISLVPIGVPAYNPREKKLKGLDEIFKLV